MILTLKRIYTCSNYTIGHLYVDGSYICDTLEDTDRMLDEAMSVDEIYNKKIKGETAIPTGRYNILMDVLSSRFSKQKYYKEVCNGYLPRLYCVKGYSGVLIHCGNTAKDTEGCILVGYNKEKGKVLNSRSAFQILYRKLKLAHDIGQHITLRIERTY